MTQSKERSQVESDYPIYLPRVGSISCLLSLTNFLKEIEEPRIERVGSKAAIGLFPGVGAKAGAAFGEIMRKLVGTSEKKDTVLDSDFKDCIIDHNVKIMSRM